MARAAALLLLAAMAMVVVMALAPAASAMEFSRADLASEKATLALYERWSVSHSVAREASDTARRLAIFTDSARRVLNESSSYIAINVFGDLTDDEVAEVYNCAHQPPDPGRRRLEADGVRPPRRRS